jgi:hypothetical protein
MSKTIRELTTEFGEAYEATDTWTRKKAKLQTEFFQRATQELEGRPLARRVVTLPDGKDPDAWVAVHHPGYKQISQKGSQLILQQDAALMRYEFVNPYDGKVYGRTTANGQPSLDSESLKLNDPKFWEKYSRWCEPHYGVAHAAVSKFARLSHTGYGASLLPHEIDKKTDLFLREINAPRELDVERVIKDDQEYKLERYLIPAPISVRLVPPRLAKPEELDIPKEEED